ncbi:MAG: endonuclease/exonuclease/phosphatase family protein [Victivallales bacterium]|nr:endonuclease/exonuclease/phosphatase family protein [Victivallales bacterium]
MNNTKVITFNVRCAGPWDLSPNSWAERLPRIRQFLNAERPVLFGVQEASHVQMVGLLDGTAYRFVGGGRDDFHQMGEYSGIFYDPRRLEVLDWGNFSLSDNPAVAGVCSWGAAYPRMATWGFFRELRTGQRFSCYNTHLDHISAEAQINGLKLILQQMQSRYPEFPQMLMGDFNVTPDNEVWTLANTVLEDARGVALQEVSGPQDATFHNWGQCAKVIDYIFVSRGITVLNYRVDDRMVDGGYLSDHYPVIVELMFGATRRPLVLA